MESKPPRDKEMPLWEHLAELGTRLKRVLIAFAVVFILMWMPAPDLSGGNPLSIATSFFITGEYNPFAYWVFMQSINPLLEGLNRTGYVRIALIAGEVWNPLAAVMYSSLYLTALVVFPYFVYQMWLYIQPALYPHEERAVKKYLWIALLLFYAGNLFGILIIYPSLFRFVVGLAQVIKVEQIFSVASVVSTWIQIAFWTGVIFETPIVMAILSEICLLNPWTLAEYRPLVYAAALILIAMVTPDTTLISTFLTFIPFAILFEIGLIWSRRIVRKCPDVQRRR
ncbi:Sec-independent protein translocase TatC [Pyrobaculum islandicum DSM 4184]|uniref:Sec-independent protein translocase protein TatC n=1 Tax=Pyrobaculum islandicum (strain DSM 4184 / JCM 9189 / GEO3) TaxID=384616 RepID=A1RUY8_PYRIL|nr:Sec-independent protein translocase TatC [Pyrobaculum islandicum]ABL88770.1 Sec-independent protein translocase TatC [Pyrobaculum islandicum DSM 4184]